MVHILVKLFNIEDWIEKGGWGNKFLRRQESLQEKLKTNLLRHEVDVDNK